MDKKDREWAERLAEKAEAIAEAANALADEVEAHVMKKTTQRSPEFRGGADC